jgi:beta-glucosidase
VGSTTRPVKELKNFDKIQLEPGESKTVTFTITTDDLKFYTYDWDDMQKDIIHRWEPGEFDIMIGANSRDVQSKRIKWNK